MAKEAHKSSSYDNSFGVASVVLGILAIVFASVTGIVIAIVGIIFSMKQRKIHANKWSRAGKILNLVAFFLSLVVIGFSIWLAQNPELLASLQ